MPDGSVVQLLNWNGAAEYLNTTPRHVKALVYRGEIAHRKIGRLVRFTRSDLDAYLEAVRVVPTRAS